MSLGHGLLGIFLFLLGTAPLETLISNYALDSAPVNTFPLNWVLLIGLILPIYVPSVILPLLYFMKHREAMKLLWKNLKEDWEVFKSNWERN